MDIANDEFAGEEDFLEGNAKLFGNIESEPKRQNLIANATAKIDYMDIIDVNKLALVNELAVM